MKSNQKILEETIKLLEENKIKLSENMSSDLSMIENEYTDMFSEIHNSVSDLDCLLIGARIIEIAKDRLDSDLDNTDIKQEYDKLGTIVTELKQIIDNYV